MWEKIPGSSHFSVLKAMESWAGPGDEGQQGDKNKMNSIMAKFEAHCNPKNSQNQQIGETIDQYVTDLKTKAKLCKFGTLTDSHIKDRIMCGITDDHTQSRLLREPDLTLQKALQWNNHSAEEVIYCR